MESKNQNSSETGTTGFIQNKSTLLVTDKQEVKNSYIEINHRLAIFPSFVLKTRSHHTTLPGLEPWDQPAPAYQVLALKVYATMPGLQ